MCNSELDHICMSYFRRTTNWRCMWICSVIETPPNFPLNSKNIVSGSCFYNLQMKTRFFRCSNSFHFLYVSNGPVYSTLSITLYPFNSSDNAIAVANRSDIEPVDYVDKYMHMQGLASSRESQLTIFLLSLLAYPCKTLFRGLVFVYI